MAKLLELSAFGLLTSLGVLVSACSSDGSEDPGGMGDAAATTGTTSTTGATNTTATSSGGGSTSTTSTTGGTASAGVLIDGTCTLLCMDDSTDDDGTGTLDGWGFEMGVSCVVPGGMADTGAACDDPMMAEPPSDPSTPGSGVLVGGTCTRVCNDDSTDDDGTGTLDGWGWEFGASCVVPGGTADPGASEACTDFEMPTTSTPGGMVEVDGTCFLVCMDDSTDDDGTGTLDGWGYDEDAMESCVVPGGAADTGTPCS